MSLRSILTRVFPPPRPALILGSTQDALRFARLAAASGRPALLFDCDAVGLATVGGTEVRRGTPTDADIEAADLVLIATGDAPRDARFARAAAAAAVPVHVNGQPDLSTFSLLDLAEGTVRPQDRVWLRQHPYI